MKVTRIEPSSGYFEKKKKSDKPIQVVPKVNRNKSESFEDILRKLTNSKEN